MDRSRIAVRKLIGALILGGFLVGAVFVVIMPNFVRSGPGPLSGIENTLRQIDGAREQYAIDHKVEAGTLVSREQLLKYVLERNWDPHADYRINPIGVYPEAILPKKFGGLTAKTIIRAQDPTKGPALIILPSKAQ